MIGLVRFVLARRAARRRAESELARPRELVVHEGLRVDVATLAKALLAIGRVDDAEALLADPSRHLARAVRRFAVRHAQVPGLLGVACLPCGCEHPSLVLDEQTNGFGFTSQGRCPAGHALPALPPYTVYV